MSSVKKNIILLYVLQGANYLVPLITLPYLTRTLGVSTFGMMGIAVGVIGVLTLVTDWGFSLTATQEVARHSDTPEHLHRLFWDTFWARMGLGAVAFIVLFLVVLVVPSVRQLGLILLAASVQVFSSMMAVGWFLQGVQRMGIFVWTFLFGRALTIPLIFVLVQGS
jgi:PST family polysaccharide transporter